MSTRDNPYHVTQQLPAQRPLAGRRGWGRSRRERATKWAASRSAFLLAALPMLFSACGDSQPGTSQRTERVPEPDQASVRVLDMANRQVDPFASGGERATVFVFIRDDCPISNRYAPEVRRLQSKFEVQGVSFRLVYPDPDTTPAKIQEHLKEYLYDCEALHDPEHALVQWTRVRATPEVAVLLPDNTLIYRGRIDDQWVEFGKARPEPSSRDLEMLLTAIVADQPVSPTTTIAVGCFIADLK